jgi:hypothetical protein
MRRTTDRDKLDERIREGMAAEATRPPAGEVEPSPRTVIEPVSIDWGAIQHLPGMSAVLEYARADVARRGGNTMLDVAEAAATAALQAETVESLLESKTTVGAEEYLDRPFLLRDAWFVLSELADGLPVYLCLDVVDHRSQRNGLVTTSAIDVVIRVTVALMKGWLPMDAELVQAKRTSRGYYPIKLTRPGARL